MKTVDLMFLFLMVAVIFYVLWQINPLVDHNCVTGHYILWYNNPFTKRRESITLWKRI